MLLLDTNVISELRNPGRADSNVRAWATRTRYSDLYISVITLFELERGVLLMERRDKAQGGRLRTWLETHVIAPFSQRVLPIDMSVARKCASLHVPDPRPERDAMIAATALIHGMTIVTRNVADFNGLGLSLLNPWEQSG